MAKGHGFYLQHAKETCLVGLKGEDPPNMRGNRCSDVIFSERRGQSQKPEEIYHIMEALVPNGTLLFQSPTINPLPQTLLALTSSTQPLSTRTDDDDDHHHQGGTWRSLPAETTSATIGCLWAWSSRGGPPPSCIQSFVRLLPPSTQRLLFGSQLEPKSSEEESGLCKFAKQSVSQANVGRDIHLYVAARSRRSSLVGSFAFPLTWAVRVAVACRDQRSRGK
jgi:hypothetical protein